MSEKNGKGLAISGTVGGASVGIALGFSGANSELAGKIVDAVVNMLTSAEPSVALLGLCFAAVCAGCWVRTGQLRSDMKEIYPALNNLSGQLLVNEGLLNRALDRLGLPRREREEPVEHDRRAR